MKTTLNKIKAHSPCSSGWKKLLKNLGKTEADNAPLALTTILESNGIDDALWCLRAVDGREREMRLYAIDCARSVQHLMTDKRSFAALDVTENFANGLATQVELDAALDDAKATARATALGVVWAASWAAAKAAELNDVRATALGAAKATAWAAAKAAELDGARATALGVVWAASWAAARATALDDQANLFVLMCEGCYA
jgi:hypothetical protein